MKADLLLGGLVVGSLLAVIFWPRTVLPTHPTPAPGVGEEPTADSGTSDRDTDDNTPRPPRTVTLRVQGPTEAVLWGPAGEELGRTDESGRVTIAWEQAGDPLLRVEAEGFLPTSVRVSALLAADQDYVVTLAPRPGAPEVAPPVPEAGRTVIVSGPEGPPEACLYEVLQGGVRTHAGRLDDQGRAVLTGAATGAPDADTTRWLLLRPRDLSLAVVPLHASDEATLEVTLDAGGGFSFEMPGIRRQAGVFQGLEVRDRESDILLLVVQPTVKDRYEARQLPLGRTLILRRPGQDAFVQLIREDLRLSAEERDVDLGVIVYEDGAEGSP